MKKIFNRTKVLPTYRKNVTYILSIFAVIYIFFMYLLGIYFGFYTASIKFSSSTFIKKILPISVLIIIIEYIREKILFGELKHKKLLAYLLASGVEIFFLYRKIRYIKHK